MKFPTRLMLLTVAMMQFAFSARAGSINEKQTNAKVHSSVQAGLLPAITQINSLTEATEMLNKDAEGCWLITSADDWNELSTNLEAYNEGSFKLTNDISITTMVGKEELPFRGTFDGQGHVINLAINGITTGKYGGAMFRFAENANFKNMILKGSVTTKGNGAGSLASNVFGTITVENVTSDCEVSTDSDDSCMSGLVGIVGENWSKECAITFNNCAFIGDLTHTGDAANENCGGNFVGWKSFGNTSVTINNCFAAPKFVSDNESFWTFTRSRDDNNIYINNSYFQNDINKYTKIQGKEKCVGQFESGEVCYLLNGDQTNKVWGQKIGTDALPQLTSDISKSVYKVSFTMDGQVMKTVFCNSPIGDKLPSDEDFGLSNATFTYNGTTFNSSTSFSSDLTVSVSGTPVYTLTLDTPTNGSISINNNVCIPGTLKKITVTPDNGYVVSTIKVTDAGSNELPVTPVSNNNSEYVFVFPKSSVTVTAEFATGVEATRFINNGMMLPLSRSDQPWTADTWTIWGNSYDDIVETPPTDALGNQWYEENYALTNDETQAQPNGDLIVWENHTASFGRDQNYDFFKACGGNGKPGNFYMRRIFTFNTETVPAKLYLSGSFDDSPMEVYINGTLIYGDYRKGGVGNYTKELTPGQMALIHTDGTPNVLAAWSSDLGGDYYLDCGLYDPTVFNYEVTDEQTARVLTNPTITGDVVIPETITYNDVTYTVTEMDDEVTNHLPNLTSMTIPSSITNLGTEVFYNCDNLQYVKSYIPVYQIYDDGNDCEKILMAAPVEATEYEVEDGCSKIWNRAFMFTEQLNTLILPRSLAYIGEDVFIGCNALTEIYSYTHSVPYTEGNAFDGIDKSAITVHVYASALDSYKETWGEEFTYVTMTDPQSISLTIDVEEAGSLRELIEEAAADEGSTIYDVVGITVTGNINQDDLVTLATMCSRAYSLSTIDLSEASIEDNFIEGNKFYEKVRLTSIKLPETLEYIGEEAFNSCEGLTAIDIPASVKRIGSYAFNNCPNLVSVTGCEGLTDPDAWEDWYVFGEDPNIEGDVYGGTTFLSLDKDATGEYEVPAGIKVIVGGAMHGRNITSVVIPASVTDLGNDVFSSCYQLTDFYVYATTPPVCHDGSMEYEYDKSIATLHVPESAIEEYENAEEWCEFGSIIPIVIGELVDMSIDVTTAGTLDDDLFDEAVAEAQISDKVLIRNLTVTGSLNADDIAYLNTLPSTLYNINMLDISEATLEDNAITEQMFYATLYKAIKLPNTVKSIAEEAFTDSRRLHEVTLPSALEDIGSYAFAGTGLTSITIPDNVTGMGDRGVQDCPALTTIILGDKLTSIPECWAEFCDNLEEVTIGKNVTSIDWRAFPGFNIKNVYCYAKNPPSWDESFYDGINEDAVLHVYSNSVSRYENAGGWEEFPTIIGDLGTYPTFDITVNVETMGSFENALLSAMETVGCEDIIDVGKLTVTGSINNDDLEYLRDNMGASLEALDLGAVTVENNTFGNYVLTNCAFEELVLPSSIEYLGGWYVLNNCVNLKTLDIPESVKSIGPDFCKGAKSLETVTGGEGIVNIESWTGMHFADCPNLETPVFFNNYFLRLPERTEGTYEMPEQITTIVRDAVLNVHDLTAIILPEGIANIFGNAFYGTENLNDIYFYALDLPYADEDAFGDLDKPSCTLHVYEEMVEIFQSNEIWEEFNIEGDLGSMPNLTSMNEDDYSDLCTIYNTLDGDSWENKWMINNNMQTESRWHGVTFDEEGYVTSIDLSGNKLGGDISSLTLTGLSRMTSLNLSYNAITGDIEQLLASLPAGCELYVEHQDFGYVGEFTIYELCRFDGLPSIAYYQSDCGTLASTLIEVTGSCQFYHKDTDGGQDWDCWITADGRTYNNNIFNWPSPVTVECLHPHHFTFTYNYEMGDANMNDVLNVLDLQSTLNYSNGQTGEIFNFYAADTYGPDDDINVQDIVSTVNILLAQEQQSHAPARAFGITANNDPEAFVSVENGQVVLYTTRPVAALELRLSGIGPEHLSWETDDMGFATATSEQGDGTHVIVYSMQPRQIEEGKTVLATFDQRFNTHLVSAVLCDSQAHLISVGNGMPTGINQWNADIVSQWSITDLSGVCIATGTHATETDILKLAKSRQLHGVFILNLDGTIRKVVIK